MSAVKQCILFFVFATITTSVAAFDMDSNVDLSLSSSTFKLKGDEVWQPLATFSTKVNAWLYPNSGTELSIRYGLSASSATSAKYLEQMVSSSSAQADYLIGENSPELWSNGDKTQIINHQLEQLLATFWLTESSISIGRQAISLGTAKVFSPADVIAPSSFDFSFSDYRLGVDALRLTWYAGPTSEVDGGFIKGSDSAAFARFKTNTHLFDVDVTALQINDHLNVLSTGLIGGLGSIGLWQETAIYRENDVLNIRSSLGADTTLLDDIYLMAEYHFNGLGKKPGDYLARFESQFYQQGAVQPAGRHYISMTATKPINALINSQFNWVANLQDHSGIGLVGSTLSLSDQASASFNLSVPYGQNNESSETEYGAFPLGFNGRLNWVF